MRVASLIKVRIIFSIVLLTTLKELVLSMNDAVQILQQGYIQYLVKGGHCWWTFWGMPIALQIISLYMYYLRGCKNPCSWGAQTTPFHLYCQNMCQSLFPSFRSVEVDVVNLKASGTVPYQTTSISSDLHTQHSEYSAVLQGQRYLLWMLCALLSTFECFRGNLYQFSVPYSFGLVHCFWVVIDKFCKLQQWKDYIELYWTD